MVSILNLHDPLLAILGIKGNHPELGSQLVKQARSRQSAAMDSDIESTDSEDSDVGSTIFSLAWNI